MIKAYKNRSPDIPALISLLLKEMNLRSGKNISLGKDVYRAFTKYTWPGNIRELENTIPSVVFSGTGPSDRSLSFDDLPASIQKKLCGKGKNYNLQHMERYHSKGAE